MTVEIVILAMIAAFLGLRLYSVLGRRAEHEEEPIQGRFDQPPAQTPGARRTPAARPTDDVESFPPRLPERRYPAASPSVERGLRDIAAADRRFDPFLFMDGARAAYRMFLEAFWQGEKAALRPLWQPPGYEHFA